MNHAIISSCVKTVEKTSTKKDCPRYSEEILVRRTIKFLKNNFGPLCDYCAPSKQRMTLLPSKMYRVSQKISVQHPTITRLPEKGVEPKMTQQKYVLQVTRVIAIVELASNKIQPVPKKNALNSKCVETE